MATYGEMEGLTYSELSRLTYDQVASLTSAFWSHLRELTIEQRSELLQGFRDRTLPPPIQLSEDEPQQQPEVEVVALVLWLEQGPQKHGVDWATWIIALATAINVFINYSNGQEDAPPPPPPTVIVINQLPPEVRPLPKPGESPTSDH